MFKGSLISINITPTLSGFMQEVIEIRAVPGKGLQGDRYFNVTRTDVPDHGKGREVTLIEIEAIEALKNEKGIELAPGNARRNLVTCGVPLNHLINREFKVGEVVLRGVRLCEPCTHLEDLTQSGVQSGLVHRGGLRAHILTDGIIKAGDTIEEIKI